MKNITIDGPCNTNCPRYCSGTCPYTYKEKEMCPKWKEELNKIKYICDAIEYLNKYFKSYIALNVETSGITVSYDNGMMIIRADMTLYHLKVEWRIPDIVKDMSGDETKTDYICLAAKQIMDKIMKNHD